MSVTTRGLMVLFGLAALLHLVSFVIGSHDINKLLVALLSVVVVVNVQAADSWRQSAQQWRATAEQWRELAERYLT